MQARILRLPVSFFDATQSGVLINRVMNDADGIRNLIGTGIIQLLGGLLTASIALGYLFWLNWFLTTMTLGFLAVFNQSHTEFLQYLSDGPGVLAGVDDRRRLKPLTRMHFCAVVARA